MGWYIVQDASAARRWPGVLGVPGPQRGGVSSGPAPVLGIKTVQQGSGVDRLGAQRCIPLGENENGPDIAMICRVAGWRVVMSICILQFAFENGNYRA